MRILKQLSATILLALVLSASAYAGDMNSPPAPGDMSGPSGAPAPGDMPGPTSSLAPGQIGGPSTATVLGDVSIPGLTAIMNVLGLLAGY
jgi:hypothetical protein